MDLIDSTDHTTPLLTDMVDGAVDYKCQPLLRSSSATWSSASFIIGMEVAERFAFYGIGANLITYLTGPLRISVVAAAEIVNFWSGTSMLLTLFGAFLADSFFGRYRTIVFASISYLLGLGLLVLSTLLPTANSSICAIPNKFTTCSAPKLHLILFFVSLSLIGIAQGGHRPCVQAFGADQFDPQNPQEAKFKSSFFNWWYFGACFGIVVAIPTISYAQENLSWTVGFGIPCVSMLTGFVLFLLGTNTYRFNSLKQSDKSPFLRIGRVFVASIRNWRASASTITFQNEQTAKDLSNSQQFKFLNKACIIVPIDSNQNAMASSISELEEAKAILRILIIWVTVVVFTIAFSQDATFFTKQAATLDRSIMSSFIIPAASLEALISFTIVIFIVVYDLLFVPIAKTVTGNPSGITTLQRIGTGMVISTISMAVASLVEKKRLGTALEHGLIDRPDMTIPMRFWWLVPQYVLNGLADVFTVVGLQELCYDQVPKDLKSVGPAIFISILGMGNILSSLLISVIDTATKANGHRSWFSNNLNNAHLDYFYLLLAALSVLGFIAFLFVAKSHVYNNS
ncbi:protein NRT1/ PTR FAMILY 5.10-like [Benincasa hispida]|uniref:protein NRT1/ PTR FAMILY 5.10-like n=1 Tax=Benincasa hispida TaxID=102211 RepID=UPI001902B3CF|nr:protein NRT1/ PTR FAMILY 5.10-like [Benincasa hispida]